MENGIIGGFHAAKMWIALKHQGAQTQHEKILIPLFLLHYGGFMALHLLFLRFVFDLLPSSGGTFEWHRAVQAAPVALLLGIGSHGVSFYRDFLEKKEYERCSAARLFFGPYPRIVVVHLTLLVGGALTVLMGSPTWMLIVLVVVKILIELDRRHTEGFFPDPHARPKS